MPPLRDYSGTAKPTTLNGAISAAATSITVADGTGYPTGAAGPFVVTIDAGLAAEEKVLCASRTGNTLSVTSRGWDGTTASDHNNAASVAHTYSATDAREANTHVNATTGNPHPQYGAEFFLALANISQAVVVTSESVTNTGFVDLATVGPSVTVTVPASGRVLVAVYANAFNQSTGAFIGVALSGANVATAANGIAAPLSAFTGHGNNNIQETIGRWAVLTGLAAGSTTFTMKYSSGSSTNSASYQHRHLIVVPF